MDDPPLVPHGDAPARCGDPELVKQKDQPSVFTGGRSSNRISFSSSEQQHRSESFPDLSAVIKNSPLTQPITAFTRTSDADLVIANPAAPEDEMNNNIMENPNVAALEKRKIQRLFDSGVPFFTKQDMEELQDQIERAKNEGSTAGQKFIFTSVTGRKIERAVMKRLSELRQLGNKEGRLEPCILYNSYQALIHNTYSNQSPCAMQICHRHQIEPQQQSSLENMRKVFSDQLRRWQESKDYRKLRSAILSAFILPVDQIFAFACGSMSGNNSERRRRSIAQHVFMVCLAVDLAESLREPINCIVQDPAYTEVDKLFLGGHGITVVDDPQGFLGVSNYSAVLSFCPNVPVRQIITDIARPSLLAWDTVTDEEHTISRWGKGRGRQPSNAKATGSAEELEACETDPPSSRVRDMIADGYTQLEKLNADLFGESSVYIRAPNGTKESLAWAHRDSLSPYSSIEL